MHLAHFIQRYPPALGGSEAYFARLSRYLADEGDSVKVFTSNAFDLSAFWSREARCLPTGIQAIDGVEVERFSCWRWPARRYFLKALSFFPSRLWQCLMMPCNPICPGMWRAAGAYEGPLDVVHATAFPYAWPVVCARRLSRRRGVPFFLTPFLHLGDLDQREDRIRRAYTAPQLRWLLRQADCIFAQTESERRALVALGVSEECVILQGLGVEFSECTGGNRDAARRHWGVDHSTPVVGLLANQSWEKGSNDLVQAMDILWQRGIKGKLVLAGPEMPNFLDFWKRFVEQGKHHAVSRLGLLSVEQKKDFFAGIDLFVLPSRSDSFGLVLLEAWANGVANIGYRAGGIADVILHKRDGLLTPCNVPALAEAIESLINDGRLRQEYGQAGKLRAERDFQWADKLAIVKRQYERFAFAKVPSRARR